MKIKHFDVMPDACFGIMTFLIIHHKRLVSTMQDKILTFRHKRAILVLYKYNLT